MSTSSANNPAEPKLDPPGKGLPFFEGLILRYWVMPRLSKKMSWEDCSGLFERECKKILAACENIPTEKLETRVLIEHIRGLEDSSRYWSIAMTLEHIIIVSRAMASLIVGLSNGKSSSQIVDVAKVKPRVGISLAQAKSEFEDMAKNLIAKIDAELGNRNSSLTHLHPWMGKINAHQWHWVMASHVYIHRKQVQAILKNL